MKTTLSSTSLIFLRTQARRHFELPSLSLILQLSVQDQELPAVLQGEQAAALHVPRCQAKAGEELRAPGQDPRSDAPHLG